MAHDASERRSEKQSLEAMFSPDSVAVIGATDRPGTVGRTVLQNLLNAAFRGRVYPVNPQRSEVLGVRAYKSIAEIPEPVDLAVLATPAVTIPSLIGECVAANAKSAVVISAGFKERGADGTALERQIQEQLRGSSMRLVGPNCLGVMNPVIGMNATFAKDAPKEPERRFAHRDFGLEPQRRSRLQCNCFYRLDARRGLGRFDLSLRR
jgi:acetyltransferase